jgi:mono/diheme cytochrome c family protein
MRAHQAVAWLLGAALLGACGGSSRPAPPTGATLFAGDCRACHSLIGNESLHKQGGDLLGYRMTRQEWVEFTREMPAPHPLSPRGVQAVVDYVLSVQSSRTLPLSTHTTAG